MFPCYKTGGEVFISQLFEVPLPMDYTLGYQRFIKKSFLLCKFSGCRATNGLKSQTTNERELRHKKSMREIEQIEELKNFE